MNYEKPIAIALDQCSEGVYLASGTPNKYSCKSIYMKGVYVQPTYSPITDGYKIGRGCEGCPAWNGHSCRFISTPEDINWDGDFRPTWEKQGYLPDEKGY